jgi:hypothetical protein
VICFRGWTGLASLRELESGEEGHVRSGWRRLTGLSLRRVPGQEPG